MAQFARGSPEIRGGVGMPALNTVLIVDDHAPFRSALRDFLSQESDLSVVGEACNLREALRLVGVMSPDVVLTDLSMQDARGIQAVSEIKRRYPEAKLIVLSTHAEHEYKHRCREAGASGYVVKDAIHADLCEAIRAVLSGGDCAQAYAPGSRLAVSGR
jgi:DNA-binding NarL/FixJ family response regulator